MDFKLCSKRNCKGISDKFLLTVRIYTYLWKYFDWNPLAKVSDWNWFRFRYLYPSQCESFRTNPKNVLYLVWWKTVKNQSDLIRLIPRHESEPIRNQVFNPHQSELESIQTEFPIRINRNDSKVGMIRIDSYWSVLKTWFRISSGSFGLMSRN